MSRFTRVFVVILIFALICLSCLHHIKKDEVIYAARSLTYVVSRFVFNKQYLVANSNYGVKYKFKTPDAVGRAIYKDGNYEPEITRFVLNEIKYNPEDIVIDVGANIGWYSLLLDHMKDGPGIIYAFEPDSLNYSLLKHNISLNGASKVVAINEALSNKIGKATLYKYGDNNLGRHSLLPLFKGASETIITTTLDNFIKKNNSKKTIRLIKIDVEGYELPVLLGAKKVLDHTENLIVEFSPSIMLQHKIAPELVIKLLYAKGFKPYLFGGNKLIPLNKEELLKIHGPLTFLWKRGI
ncbi:Methyltransf_21 domain-containing protein [Gammaproteobacteria bacterium]